MNLTLPLPTSPWENYPQKQTSFSRRTPEVSPGNNAGYSYAHAHIAQFKNAREHCVHVTDHSGWRFSTTHVMEYLHCNYCTYTCGFCINANLVKEDSLRINAKLVKEELKVGNAPIWSMCYISYICAKMTVFSWWNTYLSTFISLLC